MARPLRIAIVSREYPPFYGGGIGSYVRWIVPALTAAGVRVHVVTEAHDADCARVEVDGLCTTHRVPMAVGRGGWTTAAVRFSVNAGRVVDRLYRSGQIDVAEFAECEAAGLATLLTRQGGGETPPKGRVPVFVQMHTPSEQLFALRSLSGKALDASLAGYFLSERLAIRLADGVLAPSAFIADWTHAHYRLPERPAVIPYATGELPPPPPPAPVSGSEDGEGLSVLFIGRIEPRKGVEALIRAWNTVAATTNATLSLAGADTSGAPDGGSMRAYLEELLTDRARSRVRFLGRLTPGLLGEQYARAHLCVIPSLWENFPNTCIESMSNARAVLVGDAGGMREMIGEPTGGETRTAGETFRAGDDEDLARKLVGMLGEGAQQLAARGRVARARIERMCDPVRVAQQRIEHAQGIIERARTADAADGNGGLLRSGLLGDWRRIEAVAAGGHGVNAQSLGMPTLDPMVARWVEPVSAGLGDNTNKTGACA